MSLDRNIVLCGFMGCGKSTVGALFAQMAGAEFIDMDEFVEALESRTIPELFALYGEDGFRDREHAAVLKLSRRRGIVLAAGGGALIFERNAAALRRSGDVVFLNVSFDECYRRIKASDRPIVRANTRERLAELHREREAAYRAASDFEVAADGAPQKVAGFVARITGIEASFLK